METVHPHVESPKNTFIKTARGLIIIQRFIKYAVLSLPILTTVPVQADEDLLLMSMEDLMSMEITSVSKKSQSIFEAAAAIYVITQDDIRRSGLTSIPELLRMVPGLHVAREGSTIWAISSRGFNNAKANKMLVLMDGRTLYTPAFSGVYWDVQDTPLQDIDRIEVIRGSGSTLWGSNAVNGVINIITKNSDETVGGLVVARAGNQQKGVTLRYGKQLSDDATLRVYAKTEDNESYDFTDGNNNPDELDMSQAGFRADWQTSTGDNITLQGDLYKAEHREQEQYLIDMTTSVESQQDSDLTGNNLLFRWSHDTSDDSNWELQAYFDRVERDEIFVRQEIDTVDVELQHRFVMADNQELSWGFGFRNINDTMTNNAFLIIFDPVSFKQDLYNLYVQDEIELNDELTVTIGSKFEHNDFTGWEIQPSARFLWQLAEQQSLWGAVSRAVRTPSRSNRDIRLNVASISSPFFDPDFGGPLSAGDPMLVSIFGVDDFESEDMLSAELGYRSQIQENLFADVTIFYNDYDNLYSSEGAAPQIVDFPGPNQHLLIPTFFDNDNEAQSHGLELSVNWQATESWRMSGSYTYLKVDASSNSGDIGNVTTYENSTPENQLQLHSLWNITQNVELDAAIYYVDEVAIVAESDPLTLTHISDYTRLDIRLGWNISDDIELNLVAQNLLDDKHVEYVDRDDLTVDIPSSIYGELKIKF